MKCTNCNAELEAGAKFCTVCGQRVPEGENTQVEPAAAVTPESAPAPAKETASANETITKVTDNIKSFFSKVWEKTKELAKKADEKLDGILGDKRMYVYAGVIGLVGIIMVVSVIAAIIPDSNGYLTYDAAIGLDSYDDTVYMMKDGKAIALKTAAESVYSYRTSIDGKVTIFKSDGVLYSVNGKKTKELAEDVGDYTLSLYGDSVVYQVVDGMDITYYYCKVSNGKSVELHENEPDSILLSYTISPDGKSVAYIASDELDADLYYFNGKTSEKIKGCDGELIGMSNGGKYIYAAVENDEGKTYLHSYNKKGDDTKIDSCSGRFALNLDGTEIMFYDDGKTYISTKAKEPVRVAGTDLELLTPAYTTPYYEVSDEGLVYPVDSLYNHVYTSGYTAYYVSKKESKNVKLVKADSSNFTLDNSAEYLYYMDDDILKVLEISKGDKAEDKAKAIAKDVVYYVVSSNRKYVYFVNDDYELRVVSGKKGGLPRQISNDDVSMHPVISKDDVVYYFSDDAVYATSGKARGRKIMDDAIYGESGGYVYIIDEDTIYAANGKSRPKKLINID